MNAPTPKPIFIVGNSRSGTTLISKILRKNSAIHGFKELHFFEQLWTPGNKPVKLDAEGALRLGARLMENAREGRKIRTNTAKYLDEVAKMLDGLERSNPKATDIYKRFLIYETQKNFKTIPCEQTPQYVFFLGHIFDVFPDANVIIMLRDPRDILLSQKKKWRRAFTDSYEIPLRETFRTWANYHPILISKIWNAAVTAGQRYQGDSRTRTVRFEDLVTDPITVVNKICSFLDVEFDMSMLNVSASKSPTAVEDITERGISAKPVGRWKNSLKKAEVYWCQTINRELMQKAGYELIEERVDPLSLGSSLISLPVKSALALALNLGQTDNLIRSIQRRLIQ